MAPGVNRISNLQTEPYFNGDFLESCGNKYVAWIDIMGVRDALKKNQKAPAIWRGELLTVIHRHIDHEKTSVHTVGDGVVVLTDNEDYLRSLLSQLLRYYVRFNIRKYEAEDGWDIHLHRLIRAGVGSGEVYQVDLETTEQERDEGSPFPSNFQNTPFGPGPIDAFNAEGGSPFNIQKSNPDNDGVPIKWWKQVRLSEQERYRLLQMLSDYFQWFSQRDSYDYDPYDCGHDRDAIHYFEGEDWDIDIER